MIDYIHNRDGRATSTQVSRMDDITEDVFTPEFYFLIKTSIALSFNSFVSK